MGWKCITKPPGGKVKLPKGHVHQYMISRAFIPPWSLVMRGRKLLDQTLPLKAAGTLVSLLERFPTKYYFAIPKSRFLKAHRILNCCHCGRDTVDQNLCFSSPSISSERRKDPAHLEGSSQVGKALLWHLVCQLRWCVATSMSSSWEAYGCTSTNPLAPGR